MMRKKILIISLLVVSFSCESLLFEEDISNYSLNLLAPSEGSVLKSTQVYFNWEELEGATSYELQIAKPSFAEAEQFLVNEVIETSNFSESLQVGNYEWRVRGINNASRSPYVSASFSIEESEGFSDMVVQLLTPPDNLITNQNNQVLTWKAIPEADNYRVQIVENGNLVFDKGVEEQQLGVDFSEGEFIWKVRAENNTQSTLYSDRKILVDTTKPNTTKLLRPEDNSNLDSNTINFDWEKEENGVSDELDSLYIYRGQDLDTLIKKAQVFNSYDIILDREQTYYWYMRSFDQAGNIGDSTDVFSFTIN